MGATVDWVPLAVVAGCLLAVTFSLVCVVLAVSEWRRRFR